MPGTGQLRPVYNLTSARLVLGNAGTPVAVKSDELNRMPKGQPIGIPGAPYATPVAGVAQSMWTLCDTVTKPESVAPSVETSVIVRPLVVDGSVGPMRPDQGVLVSYKDNDWLVTDDGRHAIDLADRAVTSAVGIPVTAKATPISEGLFNALPNAGPWQLPDGARGGRAEYRWPAGESGDRLGVQGGHRVRRAALCGAARRRGTRSTTPRRRRCAPPTPTG